MEKEYYFNAEISPQFNFQPFGNNAFQTNPNFEDPMEQCSQYETALSSMVSSPTASNSVTDHFAVRELFGKLGNINNAGDISSEFLQRSSYMNSPNTSCYNTPIDSPPELQVPMMNHFVKENVSILGNPMPMSSALPALPADPGFAERAAKFSCFGSRSLNGRTSAIGINNAEFQYRRSRQLMGSGNLQRVSSSPSLNADGSPMMNKNYAQNQMNLRSDNGSNEESSVSEQIPTQDIELPTPVELGSRKRKGFPRGKAKEAAILKSPKVAEGEENSNIMKRSKMTSENVNGGVKKEEETNIATEEDKKQDNSSQKPPEPPKDYIHVRARRGQATDSHSLAERVRREKISERMKLLQDLVPGCNKVTGKAVMLDEIINYVQSLQRQVEFLSMKLSTVNSSQNVNLANLLPKDMFQPNGSFSNQMYPVESSASAYHGQQTTQLHHDKPMQPLDATLCRNLGIQLEGFGEGLPQFPAFSEDDLQSIVQTGFAPNQTSHMNVEL